MRQTVLTSSVSIISSYCELLRETSFAFIFVWLYVWCMKRTATPYGTPKVCRNQAKHRCLSRSFFLNLPWCSLLDLRLLAGWVLVCGRSLCVLWTALALVQFPKGKLQIELKPPGRLMGTQSFYIQFVQQWQCCCAQFKRSESFAWLPLTLALTVWQWHSVMHHKHKCDTCHKGNTRETMCDQN